MEPEDLSLPKRARVEANFTTSTKSSSRNDTSRPTCSKCMSDSVLAETVCFSCEVYFCDNCSVKHRSVYNNHVIWLENDNGDSQVRRLTDLLDNSRIADDLMCVRLQQRRHLKAKHIRDGMNCWISGCTVLTNGRLAVVDCDNKSVKIINTHTNCIEQYFKAEHKPWDIAELDRDHVAVTCPETKSLIVLSIIEEIFVDRTINVNVDCHGIDCVKQYIFITSTAPSTVMILDRSGNILWRFNNDVDGRPLFDWPLYLAVDPETNIILVSDYFNDKVVRLVKIGMDADTQSPMDDASQSVSKDVMGDTSQSVSKDVIGGASQSVSKDVMDGTSQSVSKDVIGGASQSVSKDVMDGTSQSVSKDVIGGASQSVSKDVMDGTSQSVSKDAMADEIQSASKDLGLMLYVSETGYKHTSLKYPRGIVFEDGGSLFLAGRYNIHQLTANLDHVHVPLDRKDGVEWAQCVAFCAKQNLLFVGKHRLNAMSNWISVFHAE